MDHASLAVYTHEELGRYTHEQISRGALKPSFITDRTSGDVDRWRLLRDKGWLGMTEEERLEWLGETSVIPAAYRGMYTHNDMNRVENAVKIIVGIFEEAGYDVPILDTKTDWTHADVVTREDIERYYSNVAILRDFMAVYPDTPKAPTIKDRLNYLVANDIEKILMDVHGVANNISKSWYYAGDVCSGEV